MIIREINLEDAENFVSLIKEVESEAEFMLMDPGERKTTAELERKRIEMMKKDGHSTIFIAEVDGKLVGYLIVVGNNVNRKKHSAYIVVGILRNYRGLGIGTKLFTTLDEWATARLLNRLELTVVTENKVAVHLYEKMGFEIEGTKRNSLMIDEKLYDEFYMAKILS